MIERKIIGLNAPGLQIPPDPGPPILRLEFPEEVIEVPMEEIPGVLTPRQYTWLMGLVGEDERVQEVPTPGMIIGDIEKAVKTKTGGRLPKNWVSILEELTKLYGDPFHAMLRKEHAFERPTRKRRR